jgi:hypothetical protein
MSLEHDPPIVKDNLPGQWNVISNYNIDQSLMVSSHETTIAFKDPMDDPTYDVDHVIGI